MRKIWKSKEPDMNLSQQLVSELEIPLLIAQLLVNRGVVEAKAAQEFLHPDLSNLHPPSMMKGIPEAVERVKTAIDKGEKIWVYGDYDVDGITCVSMLMPCLRHLGAEVDYYIPHRLDEGYGLSLESIAELKDNGCSLIITADCGISAATEVKAANDAGMDVIITDHHEPRDELPQALVTLDPKLEDCGYPFDKLAGVGVAFKLAQALMDDNGENQAFLREQLDLVALGTIVDVVPLIGENRIIVKHGLEVLNRMERPGIKALCEVSDVEKGSINGGIVGFRLGPRLNAAGRIDTARSAVQLLTTDSYEEALEIAQELDTANKERQGIERTILGEAKEQAVKFAHEKGLVLAAEGWHPGVVGIVASRIKDLHYRPAILISLEGEEGRGSARSIPEFDLFQALTKCSHLLKRFGGHKAAAGLSIAKEKIPEFRKAFSRIVNETLEPDDLNPKVPIDASVHMSALTLDVVEQLSLLEPYGLGNPRPMIELKELLVKGMPRIVGRTGAHLQFTVSDGRQSLKVIAFNKSKMERELHGDDVRLNLACRPSINDWRDMRSVQLEVVEMIVNHDDSPALMAASAEVMEMSQLKIIDRRGIPDKQRHLRKLLGMGEKSLLYVRDDAAIDQFRGIVSKHAAKTRLGLCYHETSEGEKDKMKEDLAEGDLDVVASCVPFEEPLPGLKHLVFCHPVPTLEYFARCCSPAVETDESVYVHLIFNTRDVDLLTATLNCHYPDRKILANVYRRVRDLSADKNGNPVTIAEIAEEMNIEGPKEEIISNAIAVFEEIDLAERHESNGETTVSLPTEPQERRELQESQRFASGDKIKSEWVKFSGIILKKTAEDIHKMLVEMIP